MKDNQAKYPQLRFKGFTDPWEQRKLGELGKIYTGNTPKTSDLDNWTDNKEGHIWITPTDIDKLIMSDSDRHLSEQGWSKARKIPENSVLITSIASIGKNTINAVPVAFNQQINAIVPEKNDSYFILSAMIKDTARFASVAGQTATAIINKTTFEKFQIATPSYEEQQKIGSFFKQLDNTITLHQRKLAKLKELKQGYLQKLFPKNGSKFPQLRFAGFADAWEQRKLGELGKIYTGNTPKTSDLDNWTDNKEGHIWITPTDIDKLIMSDSDRHLSEQGWSKARKIPENSVLITSIASIGKNTINAVPVAFNQQINAIVPEKNDSYFILSAMIKDTARFASVAGQTATAIINKTTFEKFQIATPSYEEQQKIGSFFKQLDNTITLHQRKLEKLQELKKGYLQKMFC